MRQHTCTLSELSAYYLELISLPRYTTVSSRKAILTRHRKFVEDYHDDLVRAYNTKARMLYGERVNRIDIVMAVQEIKIINNIYNTL